MHGYNPRGYIHDNPWLVRAFVIQITTDMPGDYKLRNAIGGNGENPGRFRLFSGVRQKRRYSRSAKILALGRDTD